MSTHSIKGANGLCYALATDPVYLTSSEQASIVLTVTNPTGQPIACPAITLSFPLALPIHDTTILTAHPAAISAVIDQGWTVTTSQPGTYVANPPAAAPSVAPSQTVTLTLSGIRTSATPGTSTLFFATSEDQTPLRLTQVQWPSDVVDDFRANPTTLDHRGDKAALTWTRVADALDDKTLGYQIDYTLTYSSAFDQTGKIIKNVVPDQEHPESLLRGVYDNSSKRAAVSFSTVGLELNPALIVLNATLQGETKSYFTSVNVDAADGKFYSVEIIGSTDILSRGNTCLHTQDATYVAGTDGFLVGWVKEDQGEANQLSVQISREGASDYTNIILTAEVGGGDNQNSNFTIPIANGSQISFEADSDYDPKSPSWGLSWHPFGTDFGTGSGISMPHGDSGKCGTS